jgi:predicted permease
MIAPLWQDLRRASRVFFQRPAFALAIVLTFAVGIGINIAIFSVIEAVLLRPLPYRSADRLVAVWEMDKIRGTEQERTSVPDFFDWKEQQRVFERLVAYRTNKGSMSDPEKAPEHVTVGEVSHDFFTLLGIEPFLGRSFTAEEDQPDSQPALILSHDFWMRRFGGSKDILGKLVQIDEVNYRIVGVLPSRFVSPTNKREVAWVPLRLDAQRSRRGTHDLNILARLRPGVSRERAESELNIIMSRLAAEYPETNKGREAHVIDLYEETVGGVRTSLLVLFAAVGFVLLIAAVNITNLLLARALERQREVAIRTALGSSRKRLVAQFLTETLLLAVIGGSLGILLAFWGISLIGAIQPHDLPRLEGLRINGAVLGFSVLVTLLVGFLCSLAPALQASRVNVQGTLQDSSRSTTGSGRQNLRKWLVVSELALAVVLVIAAGLLIKSFYSLTQVNLGLDPKNVLTFNLSLSSSKYPFPPFTQYPRWPEIATLHQQLVQRLQAVPGVKTVGVSETGPLSEGWSTQITFDDRPAPAEGERDEVSIRIVDESYFQTVGMRLLRGRTFTPQDTTETPPVVVVNEAFANHYFKGKNPVGQSVSFWRRPREIVGVVANVPFKGLGQEVPPALYPSFRQQPANSFNVAVKTSVDPESLAPSLQKAVWEIEPNVAIYDVNTLEGLVSESISQPRFDMQLLLLFALVALLLAIIGVYGLMVHSVVQRTSEIGIRLALGGDQPDILKLLVREGVTLLLMGLVLGMGAAFILTRLLSQLLFQVSTTDLTIFMAVPAILALSGLLACLLPSIKASRTDPMVALRSE